MIDTKLDEAALSGVLTLLKIAKIDARLLYTRDNLLQAIDFAERVIRDLQIIDELSARLEAKGLDKIPRRGINAYIRDTAERKPVLTRGDKLTMREIIFAETGRRPPLEQISHQFRRHIVHTRGGEQC